MKTIKGDSPTLIITGIFRKKYRLYIPLDGLYDVQHFTVAQQMAAASAKQRSA